MTPVDSVPTWVLAYAALFVLIHLVVGVYLYRRSGELGAGRDAASALAANRPVDGDYDGDAAPEGDEPVLRCGHCDTENEPGYRYCRNCVQELPSVASQSPSTGTPEERESL